MQIDLPWPPRSLWPNVRAHWSGLASAKRNYKRTAWALAKEAHEALPQARLCVHMAFCAPDRIRRDMDNMIAAMKAGLDGISDAIGVDDHLWVLTVERGPITKPGVVRVTITVAS